MIVTNWRRLLQARFWWQRHFKSPPRRRRRPPTLAGYVDWLEDRTLLSGMPPFAMTDSYTVPYDSLDTSAQSKPSVLANDYDMEMDPLTAVLVSGPSHGSLTLNSNGHFVYTPDAGYSGSDSFQYKAYDGTGYSGSTTVSLSVSTAFSAQTNQTDLPAAPATPLGEFGVSMLTGAVQTMGEVAPGHVLVYDATTDPMPVVAVETTYSATRQGASTPTGVEAQLTLDTIVGDTVYHDGTSIMPQFTARFTQQVDADTRDTGWYDWTMTLTANYSGGFTSTREFSGSTAVVNRNASEFGDNWSLAELDRLHFTEEGVLHVTGTNVASWFEDGGNGTFDSPPGPLAFSTLVQNQDDTYTLTDQYGNALHFDADGLLTSRVDRNGNTTTYDYIDADSDQVVDELETITDPFGRETTFSYTSGLLSSVTDFAGRVTEIDHDAYGRVSAITGPDPDGAGSLAAPVTEYGYSGTTSLLTSITDPLDRVTAIAYDFAGRFDEATFADESTYGFDPFQIWGLVDTSSGEGTQQDPAPLLNLDYSLTPPGGLWTDPLSNDTEFALDRFGYLTLYVDPLGNRTDYARNANGQVTQQTDPDPDGAGSLTRPVTQYQYGTNGNLTQITHPDSTVVAIVYDTDINQPTSITDELDRETTLTYDDYGNVETVTDPLGHVTEYEYNAAGQVTSVTLPDPDGAGSLTSPVIEYAYDTSGRLIEVTNPDLTTVEYTWNSKDQLTSITDELGRVTAFTYDDLDRLLTVTQPDPDGAGSQSAPVWTFTYDPVGNTVTQTDPAGNVTSYEYDERDRLVEITLPDPDGAGSQTSPVLTRAYNAAGRMTSETDALGNTTSYGYDDAGRLTSVTMPDPDGAGSLSAPVIAYLVDGLGRITRVTDPLNHQTNFEYDSRSRLVKRTDPDPDGGGSQTSPVTEFDYDDAGQLVLMTDPLGRTTAYEYDDDGRLTTTTLPDPDGAGSQTAPEYTLGYDNLGRVTGVTDPLGNVTLYEYDVNSRLVERTDPDPDGAGSQTSPVTAWDYDDAGQMVGMTDALGRVTLYEYDGLGRLIETTLPDPDDTGSLTSPVYSWTYDILGNVITATDPLGNVTSYDYDNLSRLIERTDPDPDGAGPLTSPVTSWAYNANSQVTSVTDPLNRTTGYGYDNLGRLITVTLPDPDGAGSHTSPVYTYAYSAASLVASMTDPLGYVTAFTYDNLNRLTQRTDPDPDGGGSLTSPVTQWAYDAASQMVAVTDPLGGVTTHGYDNLGRVVLTTLPDPDGAGSLEAAEYATTYDAAGNVLTRTDPLNNTTEYAYDNLYRLVAVTDPLSGVTQYAYDGVGNLTGLVDPVGNDTTWVYDDLNRLINETNELTDVGYWSYDAASRVTSRTDREGRVTEYDHDHLGRLVEERWMDGQSAVHTIGYVWDAASQLTSVADDDSAYAYVYDNLGRVLSVDNDGTYDVPQVILSMAYDANSRRTSMSAEVDSTDDFLNEYQYDNIGRMTRMEQTEQTGGNSVEEKRVDFAYNKLGQFTGITRYADLAGSDLVATTDYTFDNAHRLTALSHEKGSTVLSDYAWAYDVAGRVTSTVNADGTDTFSYDDNGQLTATDSDYQTDEGYSYDANGNRTNTGYSTGDNNRFLSDGAYNYQYDAEGNRTRKTEISSGDYVEYAWDHRNRLVSVTFKTSAGVKTKQVAYKYDAFDRRIAKDVDDNGDGTFDRGERYVYDGSNIVLVFADGASVPSRILYGPAVDQPLASENDSGDVRWMLADNQGTVRDVAEYDPGTDTTSVVNHLQYGSFGNITGQTNSSEEPRHTYTGREWDADAELYYYRARWYDPRVGRFISEDPIGFGGGDQNLSRYVGNRATNFVDPRGWADVPNPGGQTIGAAGETMPLPADDKIEPTIINDSVLIGPAAGALTTALSPPPLVPAPPYQAALGSSTTTDYRATFFKLNQNVPKDAWVHHAVEQKVLTRYPGVVTPSEMHSPENLRGIPKDINSKVHLG